MVVRFVTTKLIPAAATFGVAVTVYSSSASAFFPPILPEQPGVVVVPPPVSPQIPLPPIVPPVSPPPFVPPPIPPTVPPPVDPNDGCSCPCDVPEPATLATAAVGLGMLAAAGLRKGVKRKGENKG